MPPIAELRARLAAAVDSDPGQYLRAKLISEGLSETALARELGWPDDDVRSLVRAHRHHLRFAGAERWLGRYLAQNYPQIAFTAIFQLVAILAGFALASAWQARQDALRETREQLSVLSIVAEEIASLATEAAKQSRAENCRLAGVFGTRQWRGVTERGRALVLGPLAREIQATYDVVEASAGRRKTWTPDACRDEAKRLRGEIEVLDATVTLRVKELEELHATLIASQARDDEMRAIATQTGVLEPLALELAALSQRALTLSSAPKCMVEGLAMTEYEDLAKRDGLLALGRLRRPVEEAYDAVAVARDQQGKEMPEVECRKSLTLLRLTIEPIRQRVGDRLRELEARRDALSRARSSDLPTIVGQAQSSGLVRFLGAIMLWAIVVLAVAPAIVYGAVAAVASIAARTVR